MWDAIEEIRMTRNHYRVDKFGWGGDAYPVGEQSDQDVKEKEVEVGLDKYIAI